MQGASSSGETPCQHQHHGAQVLPTLEKQCLRSRMNAFSCSVLRAVVRHTAPQYSKGVAQSPVSGLRR